MAWGNFGWAWEPLLAKMRRGESHVVILPWPKSLATSTAGLTLSGSFCYIHSAAVPSLLLSPDALLHLAVVPPMLPPMLLLPMAVLPLLPPVLLYTAALPPATSCTAPNRGCSTSFDSCLVPPSGWSTSVAVANFSAPLSGCSTIAVSSDYFTVDDVRMELRRVRPGKSAEPNGISPWLLRVFPCAHPSFRASKGGMCQANGRPPVSPMVGRPSSVKDQWPLCLWLRGSSDWICYSLPIRRTWEWRTPSSRCAIGSSHSLMAWEVMWGSCFLIPQVPQHHPATDSEGETWEIKDQSSIHWVHYQLPDGVCKTRTCGLYYFIAKHRSLSGNSSDFAYKLKSYESIQWIKVKGLLFNTAKTEEIPDPSICQFKLWVRVLVTTYKLHGTVWL